MKKDICWAVSKAVVMAGYWVDQWVDYWVVRRADTTAVLLVASMAVVMDVLKVD